MTKINMDKNIYRSSYYELLRLNPLLKRRSVSEVEELIDTMYHLGYKWDSRSLRFHNNKINNFIRTQGLDLFTAQNFLEFYEDLIVEINTDPKLYHKAGRANFQFKVASSYLLKLLIIVLTIGWLIFNFKTISFISICIILVLLILFIRANLYNERRNEIWSNIVQKNYKKENQ